MREDEPMKKILVVEDVELNMDLLVQLLEDDYEVLTAMDGAAGIELAEQGRPDLILMDLSLPVIDGWEATRRIKTNEHLSHIPIIALTAASMKGLNGDGEMKGDREKCLEAGMNDYIPKPIRRESLYQAIKKWVLDNRK